MKRPRLTVKTLHFRCECGEDTVRGLSVGLDAGGVLVFGWVCPKCGKVNTDRKLIQSLLLECPQPPEKPGLRLVYSRPQHGA